MPPLLTLLLYSVISIVTVGVSDQVIAASKDPRNILGCHIKTAALQTMCPESLQTHLSMNAKRFTNYTEMRAELTSYIEARVGIRLKTPTSNVREKDPHAMGVGNLASLKGGKKGGKGNRKHSHVQCYDCGEYGHIGRDCPYKKGGKGGYQPFQVSERSLAAKG